MEICSGRFHQHTVDIIVFLLNRHPALDIECLRGQVDGYVIHTCLEQRAGTEVAATGDEGRLIQGEVFGPYLDFFMRAPAMVTEEFELESLGKIQADFESVRRHPTAALHIIGSVNRPEGGYRLRRA